MADAARQLSIPVILGTPRQGRLSEHVARVVVEQLCKRDDVATQMDAATLAEAQAAVKGFTAIPQPHEAIAVAVPPGGWDEASPAHPAPVSKGRSGSGPAVPYKVGNR